jgi:membrane-associated phospholipid phosphatase
MRSWAVPGEVQPVDRETGRVPPPAPSRNRSAWVWVLMGGYLVFVLVLMVARQTMPTPDVMLVLAAILALFVGRGRSFLREWIPLVLIFLAWEASRGLSNLTGFAVHSDSVVWVERLLLFGTTAPEALQSALRSTGEISTLDVAMTIVYFGHFVLPFVVAFAFWLTDHRTFRRFVSTLFGMSLVQFAVAAAFPVAPPRFAGEFGWGTIDLPVVDVTYSVIAETGLAVSFVYAEMGGNLVSAFPSLHAAYPVLVALFVLERRRGVALALLAYAALIWFATMYTGHHYLIDAIGGGLLAVIAYAISLRVWPAQPSPEVGGVRDLRAA